MDNFVITNFMEKLTTDLYESVVKNMSVCTCERCRMDTLAIALNNLPSKYVVTEKGTIFVRLDAMCNQFNANITAELVKSACFVDKNRRHDG